MKRFTRCAGALAGLAALVGLVLFTTGWGSAVAANISGVFVTNTASNPVPVSGTVTIGGCGAGGFRATQARTRTPPSRLAVFPGKR